MKNDGLLIIAVVCMCLSAAGEAIAGNPVAAGVFLIAAGVWRHG